MPTPPATHALTASHTFGRFHAEPPPMPRTIQQGQPMDVVQMGGNTQQADQIQAGSLPFDLDHLVRSVGEW